MLVPCTRNAWATKAIRKKQKRTATERSWRNSHTARRTRPRAAPSGTAAAAASSPRGGASATAGPAASSPGPRSPGSRVTASPP